jgi:hypothetical protein
MELELNLDSTAKALQNRAHMRVSRAVKAGLLPSVRLLNCVDCGGVGY